MSKSSTPMNRNLLFALLVAAVWWTQLFYQLQVEWTANAQYNYGWFVPVLAVVLLWRRWLDGPRESEVGGQGSEVRSQKSEAGDQRAEARGLWAVFLVFALLLPLRLIEEANVGWRSVYWLHACILVSLSLLLLWRAGGWPCVRHFSFPVMFLLIAVPWPSRPERHVVQGLMRFVAGMAVEVVGWFGVPAIRHGNLLEISSGMVSVDGACSGVRSLQSSIMLTLLLGELYRLSFKRRLTLIPAGVLVALIANIGRTSFLTWSAARLGFPRMESYHNSAGIAVMLAVLVALVLLALMMAKSEHGVWSAECGAGTADHGPPTADQPSLHPQPLTLNRASGAWLVAALVWLVCIEAATGYWFRDRPSHENPAWSIRWPTEAMQYQEIPLSKTELELLRYDTAKSATWQEADGIRWQFLVLQWAPHNKNSAIGLTHTPDECMKGAGWRLRAEPAPVRLTVKDIELPLRRYVFDQDGNAAYVFLALWEQWSASGRQRVPLEYGVAERLNSAIEGRRHRGLKKLEISLIGPSSLEDALKRLERKLDELIVLEPVGERREISSQ